MSRRVLITGGSSGLGAALVDEFLSRGDQVLIGDLVAPESLDKLDQLDQREGALEFLRLDVTSDDDWAAAVAWVEEHWHGIDVLINNAGIATGGRIDVVTLPEWERVIDINLLGVVRGCRAFTPMMKQQRSGHIVNTASLAGLVHPPGMASYTAVKAGVVALSETLSYELDPFGIAVSAVCPGFFRTNLASSLAGSDTVLDNIAARLIEKSEVTAPEIATAVMAGIDAKEMVIVPDEAARMAVWAKTHARADYDREQRSFAARIQNAVDGATEGNTKR